MTPKPGWLRVRGLVAVGLLLGLAVPRAWGQGQLINGSRVITGTLNAATTTGSANAYVLTLQPAITSYTTNQCFTFRANFTNTGSATLNVNGVSAMLLRKYVNSVATPLDPGDITSGQIILTCFDGAVMQLVGAGGGGTVLSGAHVLTTQAEAELSAEANLGALTSGLLKHSVSGGVSTPATASAGTDYVLPGGTVATATALAGPTTNCLGGQVAQGIDALGNAEGCTTVGGGGTGDFSSNTATAADGEAVLFAGTDGKTGRRSTLTATVVKSTAGVQSAATPGTDYATPAQMAAATATATFLKTVVIMSSFGGL